MNRIVLTAAAAGYIFAAGLSVAGTADAEPLGGENAADAVSSLQARGYDVEVQGDTESALSECTATQISGLSGKGSTVYVTVACDDDHDE